MSRSLISSPATNSIVVAEPPSVTRWDRRRANDSASVVSTRHAFPEALAYSTNQSASASSSEATTSRVATGPSPWPLSGRTVELRLGGGRIGRLLLEQLPQGPDLGGIEVG